MREFFKKHTVIKVLAAVIIFELLVNGIFYGLKFLGISFGTSNKSYLTKEVIIRFLPALIIAVMFKTKDVLSPSKTSVKSFFKGMLSGGVFVAIIITGCMAALIELLGEEGNTLKGPAEILCFILFTLSIGYSEELFCRGTITELLLRKHGNSKKGIWFSVFISGAIFGVMHITNVFNGQPLDETLLQVVCNIMTGFYLGAIYARHRNIHVVAVLHGFLDAMTMLEMGLFRGHSIADIYTETTDIHPLKSIMLHSIFLVCGMIILRSKKLTDITDREDTTNKSNSYSDTECIIFSDVNQVNTLQ